MFELMFLRGVTYATSRLMAALYHDTWIRTERMFVFSCYLTSLIGLP